MEKEKVVYINSYLNDITMGINIEKWCTINRLHNEPIVNTIEKYKNHVSIIKIKSSFETAELIDFDFVSINNISKFINPWDITKKTSGAVSTKIMKLANKQICKGLANCFKITK